MGMNGGGDGGHTVEACGCNREVRSRISAAGKVLEGDDRHTKLSALY